MRYNEISLPNGQCFQVAGVFGGFTFKSQNLIQGNSILPPGWNVVIATRQEAGKAPDREVPDEERGRPREVDKRDALRPRVTRFTTPTLSSDELYISYIVNPPDSNYKPVISPTRQIAMMLWVTLCWYFQEPEPELHLYTEASSRTPVPGKPKGDWRVNIRREGIFTGRNVLQKLERMALIASDDSSVGAEPYSDDGWTHMFVSRRSFWQLDPRLYLFTLSPQSVPHSVAASPFVRVASPSRESMYLRDPNKRPTSADSGRYTPSEGPFASHSHLPTFFPPPPSQFTITNGVRHPIRPKPPHQGEVFYVRYIPSLRQYLSFRVPYLPPQKGGSGEPLPIRPLSPPADLDQPMPNTPSDLEYLHKWMNDPRVTAAWGEAGPVSKQEEFLRQGLSKKHSFPVIGCWDGKPFGYFEIYWIKEDPLGLLIGNPGNYDRGIHVLVGEQEFRGPHRVSAWLSSLVHYCWLADMRTQIVMLEPRVDNKKIINYLQDAGFSKDGEVTFPHKQSALMKIRRDFWESPSL
ncbi:siderophore biosynthesis protein [Aspergillus lucknowensis]|uniref:Siderophore biosynthesis protein n=1 Tax=Aspergillus lucknowensis TaxID=176173 RepID=A0ABR4LZW1_9EURO